MTCDDSERPQQPQQPDGILPWPLFVVVDGCEAVALESLCLSRTVLIRAIADTRFP